MFFPLASFTYFNAKNSNFTKKNVVRLALLKEIIGATSMIMPSLKRDSIEANLLITRFQFWKE